ncbi:MAG: hypothetical protein WCG25_08655 [bacterium]
MPERKYYRRYKIGKSSSSTVMLSKAKHPGILKKSNLDSSSSIQNDGDDYASLKELITRRFSTKDFLPNLFILD